MGESSLKRMIEGWHHVFKLDPDREIGDAELEAVCTSGTDAIMVGGSSGVTYDNTVELLSRVRQYELPCVLEVSDLEAVVPGFDLYMIPMVLNAGSPEWMIGHHAQAARQYGYMIPWDMLVPEGYVVLNPDSTVAKITGSNVNLSSVEVAGYALIADRLLNLPIVYIEYSGKLGDLELVKEVQRTLGHSRLFYGGGITDAESARRAAAVCDTVVVGNVVYSDLQGALDTVRVVKGLT
ncbi:Heptaprenylglyceryl phosphate synthase [compost metagenome]